ncbi:MAG: class I SAM-dependent methyltransferase [Verrucomicrobiota bacterium]
MNRIVLPELLDGLPPEAAAARRSRRDLRRLNAWMSHPRIMSRVLRENIGGRGGPQIAELGAGDGHFLLTVARRLNGQWPGTQATLVDRLNAVAPETFEDFRRAGWRARSEIAEAAAWLRGAPGRAHDVLLSNLFLHQFEAEPLREMLRLAADAARVVVALEPRRSWLPRCCGRLLWAIGCGPVTRHDAQISIRAGFAGREISALWPDQESWRLTERPAGLTSHLFVARRKE